MLSYESYLQKLKNIKLVSVDVDGTMTDNSVYYFNDGAELRRYNVKDGVGLLLLQSAGVKTAMMTTGTIDAIRLRGEKLKMDYVEMGVFNKAQRLKEICDELGISMDEVAHIGDDINDIAAFKAVGLAVCVADASNTTLEAADYKLSLKGGKGAVREFTEDYFKATGQEISWENVERHIHFLTHGQKNKLSNG